MKNLDQSGMSLVQVMVVAAIMGGLALVMMQMMENNAKQQKTTTVNGEITSTVSTMTSIVQSDATCSENFTGQTLTVGSDILSMGGLKISSSASGYTPPFGSPIDNLVSISKVEVKEISDLVNGRGRVKLDFTFQKESNTSGKRTTVGPAEVIRSVEFFALFCRATKWGPGGDENGDGFPDFPCAESLSDAKSVCDLSCEGQTVGSVTFLAGCYCDDHPDFVSGVPGANGETCFSFLVYDDCKVTQPIARCDN